MDRRPRVALLAALACAVAGALVYLASLTSRGISADHEVLSGFTGLRHTWLEPPARIAVALVDPLPFVLLCAALVALALARRRPRHAVVVALVLAGSSVTTQLLKPLLAASRPYDTGGVVFPEASWPSGHTTSAMALALCLVLIAPPRLRPLAAAAGGAFAVAVGFGLLLLNSHFPTDVLGAMCVSGAWLALGVAGLGMRQRHADAAAVRLRAVLAPSVALAMLAAAAVGALALARPETALAYAQDRTTFVAAAVAMAAAALGVVGTAAVALRAER